MPATEIWKRYRPRKLDDLIGQAAAVRTIRGWGDRVPHAVLFTGPPGTGKTSAARVLARMVGCDPLDPANRLDYREINCGSVDPLRTVQEIDAGLTGMPMAADARVIVLDETQAFSRSRFAQEGLLKILEDGTEKNPHVWLFLCSTDPQKILKAIRSRCSPVEMKEVSAADLSGLLKRVAAAEKIDLTPRVVDRLVERAGGSPRALLKDLETVAGIDGEPDRLAALGGDLPEAKVTDLFAALMPFRGGGPDWKRCAAALEGLVEHDPEGLRQAVLKVARGRLLKDATGKGDAAAAYRVISCLDEPLFDRNTGHALLAAGCFRVCFGKQG